MTTYGFSLISTYGTASSTAIYIVVSNEYRAQDSTPAYIPDRLRHGQPSMVSGLREQNQRTTRLCDMLLL